MANSTKTAAKIKSQISRFSAKMSKDLDKPKRKFIHQMIFWFSGFKRCKAIKHCKSAG